MKYIIKNCPAIYINHNNEYDCDKADYSCQDCTDCVMKWIVEKCKDMASDEDFYAYDFAKEILQKLEIEECNEQS